MERRTKLRIVIAISMLYAVGTLWLAFMIYVFNAEGKTISEVLRDNDGRSAFIQLFLSIGLIMVSLLSISLKRWTLYVLKSLLLLTFANMLSATLLYHRFKLLDLVNPILWAPIVIFVFLKQLTGSYATR